VGKWLTQFKENNTSETPTHGTDITDVSPSVNQKDPATLFQVVTDELAALWQPGTRAYLKQHRPELAKGINTSEATANEAWLACEDGIGTLDCFKTALETWRQTNIRAIRAYDDNLPLNLAGADPAGEALAKEQMRRQGYFLMHSQALGERIAVIEHDRCRQSVPRGVPVYTLKEIRLLQQGIEAGNIISIADLRLLHSAKRDLKGMILK
jgi:hypothetical protein